MNDYAKMVSAETNNEFEGMVVESISGDTDEVTYALYILSSQFGNIMYRLIEVTLRSIAQPYPLTIKLFTLEESDYEPFRCFDSSEYKGKLEEYVESDETGKILGYLDKLVKIRTYESKRTA